MITFRKSYLDRFWTLIFCYETLKKEDEKENESQKSYAVLENSQSTGSIDSRSEVTSVGVFTQQIQKRNVDFNFVPDPSQPLCPNTVDDFTQGKFL